MNTKFFYWLATLFSMSLILVGLFVLRYYFYHNSSSPSRPIFEQKTEIKCIWIAGRRLGAPIQLLRPSSDVTSRSVGFDALISEAESLGLQPTRRRIDWEHLCRHEGVAILQNPEGIFVLIDPREKRLDPGGTGSIHAYFPDRPAVWLIRSELESWWSGDTILLHLPPQPASEGPVLSFATCYEDSGFLADAREAVYKIVVRNSGEQPLLLRAAQSSCSCTTVKLATDIVPPGQQIEFQCTVDLSAKEGSFIENVILETNDPRCSRAAVYLCGTVPRHNLISSTRIQVGGLVPGSRMNGIVAVYDPGEGKLRIGDLHPQLLVPVKGSQLQPNCKVAKLPLADLTTLQKDQLRVKSSDIVIQFEITVPDNCIPDWFQFVCPIDTNLANKAIGPLYIEGTVLPDLTASPPALVVNSESIGGKSIKSKVVLTRRSGNPVKGVIVHHNDELKGLVSEVIYHEGQAELSFEIPFRPLNDKAVEGVIACKIDGGHTIDVPILISNRASVKKTMEGVGAGKDK